MKYGQLEKSKYSERNGLKLDQWISVDLTNANLRKHGFATKRGWNEVVEFKVTHLFDDVFVGLSGSLNNMVIPYKLLNK